MIFFLYSSIALPFRLQPFNRLCTQIIILPECLCKSLPYWFKNFADCDEKSLFQGKDGF